MLTHYQVTAGRGLLGLLDLLAAGATRSGFASFGIWTLFRLKMLPGNILALLAREAVNPRLLGLGVPHEAVFVSTSVRVVAPALNCMHMGVGEWCVLASTGLVGSRRQCMP